MKLGEALTQRSILAREIDETKNLTLSNLFQTVKVHNNEIISGKDNDKYIDILTSKQFDLCKLISKINNTNSATKIVWEGKSISLTEAIAIRDYTLAMCQHYKNIMQKLPNNNTGWGPEIHYGVPPIVPRKTLEMLKAEKEGIDVNALIEQQKQDQTMLVPALKYEVLQSIYNQFAKKHREIDILIQETNWKTDLI